MRSRKSINDELAQAEQDIKRREAQIKRQRESGDNKSADKNQGILNNRIERRDELKNNLEFANRQVTLGFSNLNVSESDLERDIMERGGTITRTPGAVAPDLRVSVESDSDMSFGKMSDVGLEPSFMADTQIEMPKFDISSATGEMTDLGDTSNMSETPKVPLNLNIQNLKSDPKMFSGNKSMIYDIGAPKAQNTTVVLPTVGADGGPESSATGSSGPNINEAPQFSPFDKNNPTSDVVMSIYNVMY